jgi:hypothetical protein
VPPEGRLGLDVVMLCQKHSLLSKATKNYKLKRKLMKSKRTNVNTNEENPWVASQ